MTSNRNASRRLVAAFGQMNALEARRELHRTMHELERGDISPEAAKAVAHAAALRKARIRRTMQSLHRAAEAAAPRLFDTLQSTAEE